jgi:formate hydrogenlyase transcriptional activator
MLNSGTLVTHPNIAPFMNAGMDIEKENSKDQLLAFHSTLLMSKTKEELITNIHEQFRRFFPFSHCSLLLCNDNRTRLKPYMIDPASKLRDHPLFDWITHHDFAVDDGINNIVLDTTEPVLIRISDYTDKPDAPNYIPIIRESGLNEVLAISLQTESGAIGLLCFFSKNENAFSPQAYPVVQSAAPIIAKSTVSFLRQEEIRRRDVENEAIMALNNRLIGIRTKEDFQEVIDVDLRRYIPYEENNLLLYVPEKRAYRMFGYNVLPGRQNDPVFRAMVSQDYPDMNVHRKSHLPELTNVSDLVKDGLPWAKTVYEMGVRQVLHLKLLDGKEVMGQLVLMSHREGHFTKAHISLLRQLTFQLAKGMANILAAMEIRRRDEENRLLLEISSAMNSVREKRELLPAVKQLLQTVLSFSDICISCYDFSKGTYRVFARDNSKTE